MTLLANGMVERIYGTRKLLKLRYITHKKEQQTYEKICDEITGTKNHQVGRQTCIVAYGDASFSSSCRAGSNNLPTPTTKLLKKITSRSQVVMINEHRTSLACFRCDRKTTEHPLTKEFRRTQFLERHLPPDPVIAGAGARESAEAELERIKQKKRSSGISRIRVCCHCLSRERNNYNSDQLAGIC